MEWNEKEKAWERISEGSVSPWANRPPEWWRSSSGTSEGWWSWSGRGSGQLPEQVPKEDPQEEPAAPSLSSEEPSALRSAEGPQSSTAEGAEEPSALRSTEGPQSSSADGSLHGATVFILQ
ncbi:unnamed protein product [Polarella glacialis]|uniref:Uncharacterized protein n=1 Tax=Polarella glacialis TaxID=89957 RepID=A0A813LAR0_POLGL|nr:unnamed protein product [Polarella glacialis]